MPPSGDDRQRPRSAAHVPASTCLDSGGRSYGRVGLVADDRDGAVEPRARSSSAARSPASEAPTTTIRGPRVGHSSTMVMACLGQRRTASSTLARSSSGGVSSRT